MPAPPLADSSLPHLLGDREATAGTFSRQNYWRPDVRHPSEPLSRCSTCGKPLLGQLTDPSGRCVSCCERDARSVACCGFLYAGESCECEIEAEQDGGCVMQPVTARTSTRTRRITERVAYVPLAVEAARYEREWSAQRNNESKEAK